MIKENFESIVNYRRNVTSYSSEYFNRITSFLIKDYNDSFAFYKIKSYSLYIFKKNREYDFNGVGYEGKPDESQTVDKFFLIMNQKFFLYCTVFIHVSYTRFHQSQVFACPMALSLTIPAMNRETWQLLTD
ncbi:Uncharacterised protein [Salmonella enterica subsp. enterica serovar Sanjuan]|uniref:Uncharacterized protein n=1 Tax=Salmonella enterica subsp. enterica serovar Sanjuan TaxID=1160765 RepID=A0A3S4FDD9_SALET|nr:Uncharacterised protein [Salmonella enterica subsp. enterica serovar Sanjuan]